MIGLSNDSVTIYQSSAFKLASRCKEEGGVLQDSCTIDLSPTPQPSSGHGGPFPFSIHFKVHCTPDAGARRRRVAVWLLFRVASSDTSKIAPDRSRCRRSGSVGNFLRFRGQWLFAQRDPLCCVALATATLRS